MPSANFHIDDDNCDVVRSFIITKKSHGPNLVPWGTPAGTFVQSEKQSLIYHLYRTENSVLTLKKAN